MYPTQATLTPHLMLPNAFTLESKSPLTKAVSTLATWSLSLGLH